MSASRILVLQHSDHGGPGSVATCVERRGMALDVVRLDLFLLAPHDPLQEWLHPVATIHQVVGGRFKPRLGVLVVELGPGRNLVAEQLPAVTTPVVVLLRATVGGVETGVATASSATAASAAMSTAVSSSVIIGSGMPLCAPGGGLALLHSSDSTRQADAQ